MVEEPGLRVSIVRRRKTGERLEFTPGDVLATADYCKPGYGVLTGSEREAIRLFAKHEGLLLDPVYTGRAASGMIDLIRQKFFKNDDTVLFLHPGGQPALFADEYANRLNTKEWDKALSPCELFSNFDFTAFQ